MKHKNIYIVIALLCLIFNGCNKDFGDINNDPNKITDVGTESLFHNMVGTLGQPTPGANNDMQCYSPMMQYVATTNGNFDVIGNTYTIDGTAMGIFSGIWRAYSVDYYRYLNLMDSQLAKESNIAVKKAQVDILRALLSSHYANIFGPIPFDEGGRGLEGIIYPVYRSEKDVYLGTDKFRGILQLLDDAINTLQTSSDEAFANDILYNGNKDKWVKFAASLLLRNAIQISNAEPAIAESYTKKAVAAGLIVTMDDVAKINHQKTVTGQPNYLDNSVATELEYRIGARGYSYGRSYITALKTFSATKIDPRLKYIAAVYDSKGTYYPNVEDYEGMKNGCEMDDVKDVLAKMTFDQDFTAGIGVNGFATFNKKTILNRSSSYVVVNPGEVNFLLAEAVLKGYITGNADAYYKAGIKTAMQSVRLQHAEITDAEIDDYINALPALGTNTTMNLRDELDEIITQKWLASFANGMIAWNDWRRTHYPSIITDNPIVNKLGVTDGKIIGRLPFPQDELLRNKKHYDEGIQFLENKTNDYKNDLWWAKQYH